jgi:hypothetical protein
MKQRLQVLAFLLLCLTAAGHRHALSDAARDAQWLQDIEFLKTELPRLHKNAFHTISRERFLQEVEALEKAVPTLRDDELRADVMRIVAMVGDAHTSAYLSTDPSKTETFPLGLWDMPEGIFAVRVPAEYREVLGKRLVRIGNTDIQDVKAAISPLISAENQVWRRHRTPSFLVQPDVLRALNIVKGDGPARFVFADAAGKETAVEVKAVLQSAATSWVSALNRENAPLYLRSNSRTTYYRYEYLESANTLYFQYNVCAEMPDKPFAKFNEELWAFISQHAVERLVVDLRLNGGGNSAVIEPFIKSLREDSKLNKKGRLFALIGPGTFSSGMMAANDLRHRTNAILVGEPTGGKPNAYGDIKSFDLPNSRMKIQYSTKYFIGSVENTPVILPDVLIHVPAADFFAGKDPVLEAVLPYREPSPIGSK